MNGRFDAGIDVQELADVQRSGKTPTMVSIHRKHKRSWKPFGHVAANDGLVSLYNGGNWPGLVGCQWIWRLPKDFVWSIGLCQLEWH